MSVRPIRPSEAAKAKQAALPDAVILAFNELIAENLQADGRSVVRIKDARERIAAKLTAENPNTPVQVLTEWLDVEPIYRKAGWTVVYESPCMGDSWYEPFMRFSKKRST
jgi:hypothetical protein